MAILVLLGVAAVGCGTLLNVADDPPGEVSPLGGDGGTGGGADGASTTDAAALSDGAESRPLLLRRRRQGRHSGHSAAAVQSGRRWRTGKPSGFGWPSASRAGSCRVDRRRLIRKSRCTGTADRGGLAPTRARSNGLLASAPRRSWPAPSAPSGWSSPSAGRQCPARGSQCLPRASGLERAQHDGVEGMDALLAAAEAAGLTVPAHAAL